jgi:hypothetical protein
MIKRYNEINTAKGNKYIAYEQDFEALRKEAQI